MAPNEIDRKKESTQKGPLCCAVPVLPPLPKFSNLSRDIDGCLRAANHLHSILLKALNSFKDSILINVREVVQKHPHLSLLLPPQMLSTYSPSQMQVAGPRQHNLASYNFAAILPGDSVATLVVSNGLLNFFNIYNTMLIVRLILTWFPEPPRVIVNPLSTLCDPYLNIFRGIIPPLGGTIDLSPILAFLVLNVFTNSAAALPAELSTSKATGVGDDRKLSDSTHSQRAWMRRLAAIAEARKGARLSS
ncbi:hypothetical protein KP509_12G048700 [Ceratopteris richardii]|uniref:Uncharacterized protein n=1 Tax=Ceratopteris richardii TaxID=49495 RepID=A0A8T2TIW3_CERRI|nr:hypothetical protein KP509_12G048700 [Ceratopteris richardii]